jgi:hypothetical protein
MPSLGLVVNSRLPDLHAGCSSGHFKEQRLRELHMWHDVRGRAGNRKQRCRPSLVRNGEPVQRMGHFATPQGTHTMRAVALARQVKQGNLRQPARAPLDLAHGVQGLLVR